MRTAIDASEAAATTSGQNPGSLFDSYRDEISSGSESDLEDSDSKQSSVGDEEFTSEDVLRCFELYTPHVDYSMRNNTIFVTGTIDSTEWEV